MSDVKEMTLQEEYDLYKVIKEKQVLKLEKLQADLALAKEYIDDCAVSHVESRYKYRARVIQTKLDKKDGE